MRWKASFIAINDEPDGYLGTFPTHRPAAARDLISGLRLGLHRAHGRASFDAGIYPDGAERSDALFVGAYDGACLLSNHALVDRCFLGHGDAFVDRLMARFPAARVLALKLHSDIGLYGYAYYENGECQRIHEGSSIDGILVDEGAWLQEEKPFFSESVMRHGLRVSTVKVDDEVALLGPEAYGEEIALAVSKRFFGVSLQDLDRSGLAMEIFSARGDHAVQQRLQRSWGQHLGRPATSLDGSGLAVVRTGEWLYAQSVPQPVTILEFRGFDHPTLESDPDLKDFFAREGGDAVAYIAVFGALHAHSLGTTSSGPFRTLAEAVESAEERAPSAITWSPDDSSAEFERA